MRDSTKRDYIYTFGFFAEKIDVNRVINQVDLDLFHDFLKQKMTEQSVDIYFKRIRACYNFVLNKGRTDIKLIFDVVDIEKNKKDRFLSIEEWQKLIDLSNNDIYVTNIRHQNSINKNLEIYCEQAVIEKITCHTFRHTFSTWATQGKLGFLNGKPMDYRTKKMFLGHSLTSNITEDYTHDDFKDIFKRIQ